MPQVGPTRPNSNPRDSRRVLQWPLLAVAVPLLSALASSVEAQPAPAVCDRTTQVKDAIVAQVAGVTECANVTAAHLEAITQLDLDNTGITSLTAGDFNGLTALDFLLLRNNDLTALPPTIFSGLTALTELVLDGNQLSSLPAGIFTGLSAMNELSLGSTRSRRCPVGSSIRLRTWRCCTSTTTG